MRIMLTDIPQYARFIKQPTSLEFTMLMPSGPVKCTLYDAYFGMFLAEGIDNFLIIRRVSKTFTIECEV